MKLNDLFILAANRSDAWNNLWQLYIAISTALLAIVSASSKALSNESSLVICMGFVVFIIGNYSAFLNYNKTRNQIHKMIVDYLSEHHNSNKNEFRNNFELIELSKLLGPPLKTINNRPAFFYYYWSISSIVLLTLWLIPYLRR